MGGKCLGLLDSSSDSDVMCPCRVITAGLCLAYMYNVSWTLCYIALMMACVTAAIEIGGVLCYLLLLTFYNRSISAWCWNLPLLLLLV